VLPYDPGSWTAAFKEIAGVPAGAYTGTQRTNLTGKNGNFYEPTAGTNIAWEGKSAQGQFIDITQFVDWLEARLAEAIFEKLVNAKKIPYTAKGIAVIEGAVRQVLKTGVAAAHRRYQPRLRGDRPRHRRCPRRGQVDAHAEQRAVQRHPHGCDPQGQPAGDHLGLRS
jgi:hypothetical protein